MTDLDPQCIESGVHVEAACTSPCPTTPPLCGGCYDEHDQHACLMGEYD